MYAGLVATYCENPYIRYIISSNIALAFSMIGEEKKSLEIFKILSPLSLRKTDRGTNTHSMAYQSLLQATKYFNLGVFSLRKIKTETMMNQRYEEFATNEVELYEPYQKYFHKAIESLNDQILFKKSRYSEAKRRYYSGDFRVTHQSKSSFQSSKDTNLAEAMEIIAGYSYYCLGVLSKEIDTYSAEIFFERSYKFLKSLNDQEMLEVIQRELYEAEYSKEGPIEELENFHIIFNTMFGISDRFSIFIIKLYDIEMPHFTYYTALPRMNQLENASRSTSQNVRLEDDSISSPIIPTNYHNSYKNKKRRGSDAHTLEKETDEKSPKKKYKVVKKRFSDQDQQRVMTSAPKPNQYQEFDQNEAPKKSKRSDFSRGNYDMEHGEEYHNQQQAQFHTSDLSENDVSETIDYVSQTILESKYKKKNKKKVIRMKKKRKPAPYKPAQYLSESTEDRYQPEERHTKLHTEQSSSLKELFRGGPQNYSKENSMNDHFETPIESKVNFESEGDQNNRSDSLLVPLADQESALSNKDTDYEKAEYDEEQTEKAIFIQKAFRQKQKTQQTKQTHLQEENEKASLIQKHYRLKLQKRKEKAEENTSATLIQRRYRQKLEARRHTEENEKASVIQRLYREKKQKQRDKEENEKATVIQKLYREKKQKQKGKQRGRMNQDIDEVLGVVVDKDMENTASFIQQQYRRKKAKEAKVKEEDPAMIVSMDPAERKIQEEKASLIQQIFRQKKAIQK